MIRKVFITSLAVALIFLGWIAGRSQTSEPDFELVVDAPAGETVVECVRGCDLRWVERGNRAAAGRDRKFVYSCGAVRCGSGRIGGFVIR
jgi:hypothetical protein